MPDTSEPTIKIKKSHFRAALIALLVFAVGLGLGIRFAHHLQEQSRQIALNPREVENRLNGRGWYGASCPVFMNGKVGDSFECVLHRATWGFGNANINQPSSVYVTVTITSNKGDYRWTSHP